jgi:hypothetical protein
MGAILGHKLTLNETIKQRQELVAGGIVPEQAVCLGNDAWL